MDVAHLLGPFQFYLYVFLTLYHRKPMQYRSYEENLTVIQLMNLDDIWPR